MMPAQQERPAGQSGPVFSSHPGIAPLSDHEFSLFQAFIKREAGINLSESKKALLVGRLSKRLRTLSLTSFMSYYRLVQTDAAERVMMIDALATNETHFFREPRQFEFLEQSVYPGWREQNPSGRHVRIWSAGCSTGEEPYSLAMSALGHFPRETGFTFEIFATDISTVVLAKAKAAVWPLKKSAEIPLAYRRAFMLKGQGDAEDRMMAGRQIRSLVHFERLNLQDDNWAVRGSFDLILCRNVMIYFDAAGRARATRRLMDRLVPNGLFFLGHSESMDPATISAVRRGPMIYSRADGLPDAPRATS